MSEGKDEQTEVQRSPEHHPGERWVDQHPGKRHEDKLIAAKEHGRLWILVRSRENWYRDVWLFIITLIVLVTVVTAGYSFQRARDASEDSRAASFDARKIAAANARFIQSINRDAAARRDESCRYFERQEEIAIKQIRRTYNFLDSLKGSDRGSSLTRAIVRGLPDQYAQAKADKAPAYCDEPRVGLTEPGPRLPKQRDFSFLLR